MPQRHHQAGPPLASEQGQTSAEFGLILLLVSVASIGIMEILGIHILTLFESIPDAFNS
jgi:Flp pilus assembly pilin Flp